MLVPGLVYAAINAGRPSAGAWGMAISTDTAFALGTLALLGRRVPGQVRTFLLTALVVDDVVALVVIALVYSKDVRLMPLLVALAIFVVAAPLVALAAFGVAHALAEDCRLWISSVGLLAAVFLRFSALDHLAVQQGDILPVPLFHEDLVRSHASSGVRCTRTSLDAP